MELEHITLTADEDALPTIAGLVHSLRARGVAVTPCTFLRTDVEDEKRAVLLLTLHRPLEDSVDLMTALVCRSPTGVWPALVTTLQALGGHHAPAVLQFKAEDAFVSLVTCSLSDVEQAVRLLTPVVMSIRSAVTGVPRGATERRLVYSAGSWTVYGLHPHGTLVYDAATGRLRSASVS